MDKHTDDVAHPHSLAHQIAHWDLIGSVCERIRKTEIAGILLFVFIFIGSLVIGCVNIWGEKYSLKLSSELLGALPGFILLIPLGILLRKRYPYCAQMMLGISWALVLMAAIMLGASAIALTPHTTIDNTLYHLDASLGFHVTALMAWAHQFPSFINVLNVCYLSWGYQITLVPIALGILKKQHRLDEYVIAFLSLFIIGGAIYYFFPTVAPAGVEHSAYFTASQHQLVTFFMEVHHHQSFSQLPDGLIAFPSFHVMYALLILFVLRSTKWLLFPMLIINGLLIFSTMALGYHYLMDVLASTCIAAITLPLTHWGVSHLNQGELIKSNE